MHDEPRTTDELPVNPDEQPDDLVVPVKDDHVLADWKAADPDAFRPAGVARGDDEAPLNPEDDDVRRSL